MAVLGALAVAPVAAAQSPRAAGTEPAVALAGQATPAAAPAPAAPADEQIDVWDYLRQLRHKPPVTDAEAKTKARGLATTIVPLVSSKPSAGFSAGVGASLEFPLGDLADTYVSSVLIGASASTKKQYSVSVRPVVYGTRNWWLLSGDNHFQQMGQDTYGLGTSAAEADGVNARFKSTKFVDTYYRQITRGIFAGVGLEYRRQSDFRPAEDQDPAWDTSPFVVYSQEAGFDLDAQVSAGLALSVRRDSRDNVSDPRRGWFAEATYRAYMADFLGGDSTWQRLYLDLRTYRRLTDGNRQKFAFWAYGDFVTAGTAPYFMLPATGTDPMGRSGRGYGEGRFRGDQLIYGEVEYRVSLRRDGLVGMVGFLNATTVGSTFANEALFDSVAVGAGFGLRLRLQKRSRSNICLDFGWGREGSRGIYIALAEAF